VSARLQNAGLAVLLLVVVALVGSAVMGVGGKRGPAAAVQSIAPGATVAEPLAGRITVEVLNASGRPGLAKDAMRYLRARGFDVVQFGNAKTSDGTATRVISRRGDTIAARTVADSLGIRAVARQVDTLLQVDASVVLGAGWKVPGSTTPVTAPTDSALIPPSQKPASPAAAQPSSAKPRQKP
jgi:hypothetical protein